MERGETLPRPRGVVRKRRLGMEAREMSTLSRPSDEIAGDKIPDTGGSDPVPRDETKEARAKVPDVLARGIRPGYMFREANWQIGRVEDKEGKNKVRTYEKGDRFLAWRKRTRRLKLAAEKRSLRGRGKKKTGGR
ncbi:MAG: hypothetical protein Q9218_005499 [Villophora microphyllina]